MRMFGRGVKNAPGPIGLASSNGGGAYVRSKSISFNRLLEHGTVQLLSRTKKIGVTKATRYNIIFGAYLKLCHLCLPHLKPCHLCLPCSVRRSK